MVEKPDINNCTEKQFEKWWWYDFNKICKRCTNECKQSHRVEVSCNKYIEN